MLCGDLGCSIALCQLQEVNKQDPGLMLYGFYDSPSLHKVTTWFEACNVLIPIDSQKVSLLVVKCITLNFFLHFARDVSVAKVFFFFLWEWIYYLNAGSIINISYSVYSSSSIFLVIADGCLWYLVSMNIFHFPLYFCCSNNQMKLNISWFR